LLLAVCASTREPELAAVEWDAAQKAAFVEMRFDREHAYCQDRYVGAAFDAILADGQPAGRLYVAREDDEIRIVDIALLSEFCNSGMGDDAAEGPSRPKRRAADKPLRTHVERFHPALRLLRTAWVPRHRRLLCICSWSERRRRQGKRENGRCPREYRFVNHPHPIGPHRHEVELVGPQFVVLDRVDALRQRVSDRRSE
jgi:hypothetical protein